MSLEITIRKAEASDLERIAAIAVACFSNDFLDGNKDKSRQKEYASDWVNNRQNLSPYGMYHVAEIDGEVVGYVFHLMIGGLSGVVQLEQIGVDPNHRTKGIGTSLILESEKLWKQHIQNKFNQPLSKMILTTSRINDQAHNLYTRCGFAYETTVKNMYWREAEEIWVKEIK